MIKTDKKIEEYKKDKDRLFNKIYTCLHRVKEDTEEKGINPPMKYIEQELIEEIFGFIYWHYLKRTEVQKAVEDGVRDFCEYLLRKNDGRLLRVIDNMHYTDLMEKADAYLQSLDKGDRE